MNAERIRRFYFFGGLFIIILLYALYYAFFLYGIALDMPLRGRHVVKFLFIAGVYITGILYFRRRGGSWALGTWHMVYGLVVVLLVMLGLYDWVIARTPLSLREVADDLLELVVSPLLYVVLGLLGGGRRAT